MTVVLFPYVTAWFVLDQFFDQQDSAAAGVKSSVVRSNRVSRDCICFVLSVFKVDNQVAASICGTEMCTRNRDC